MTIENPSKVAVASDLASARFRLGLRRGYWRVISDQFPNLTVAVASVSLDGAAREYAFRFELSGFPGVAPMVQIWNLETNALLVLESRPKGSARVNEAFKTWGSATVYRPWERLAGAHNNWNQTYPNLAWHPKRDISFILEDLHELLNYNPSAGSAREAA